MAATEPVTTSEGRLTLGTWLRFLFGSRSAIEAFATSRGALWVGLLMVLSAGFAREYDGEYLLREPWHLLLPLVGSLATSIVLYTLVYVAAEMRGVRDMEWWSGYRTLLTFYWMSAPLAWLYAIPVERQLDTGAATTANLSLLAVVSLWRVLLMTRALEVWLDASFWAMLILVLFFGDSVSLVAATITPTPIWNVMGGIRLPERESVILNVKLMIWFWGTIAWFVLLLMMIIVSVGKRPKWSLITSDDTFRPGASLWAFAGLLLVSGLALLPFGQPEQKRRWRAESLLHAGQVTEAVEYMSQRERDAFPPHWDPPPRTSYGEEEPPIEEVLRAAESLDAPTWLADMYLEKLLATYGGLTDAVSAAKQGDARRLEQLVDFFERDSREGIWGEMGYELREAARSEALDESLRRRIERIVSEQGY